MSIAAQHKPGWAVPASRPVIEMPGLRVVPAPAPARGFFGTVLLCLVLFLGSLGVAFHLNTRMVQGAYDLKNINVELNEVSAREATLEKEAITVSTPAVLKAKAQQLGLVPAGAALHIDLETGVITAPAPASNN
ncbi:hypothetical protein [Trueperella sp. LYQ143]|uniref:hypothetical protein n=1 Tax=unclassified Trueperella TaxID=2630174 RepID=UPI00398305F8